MGEIRASHIFYVSIVFVIFIAGGLSLFYEAAKSKPEIVLENNSESTVTDFNTTFNQFVALEASAQEFQKDINQTSTNPGTFGFLDSLISMSYTGMQFFTSSIGYMFTAIGGFTTMFGIPWWITGALVVFIIMVFVFTMFSVIFQREV